MDASAPIRAIADAGDPYVVFTDHGATVFSDANVTTSPRTASWVQAALVPAADQSGPWIVGIDADGGMHRLRARQAFEPVSARYGLAGTRVRAAGGAGGAALFAVDGGFVVSDGEKILRYPLESPILDLAAGPDELAFVTRGRVVVIRLKPFESRSFEVEARAIAIDRRGRLAVETDRAVYLSDAHGDLALVYGGSALHGLATSADRLYFADERQLFVLEGAEVKLASQVSVSLDARLVGSPSGDVWALSASGALRRFASGAGNASRQPLAPGSRSAEPITYARDIGPLVARVCAPCHAESGSTGIVLTTEAGLRTRRDLVRQRVLEDRDMPPRTHPLAEADRATFAAWLASAAR